MNRVVQTVDPDGGTNSVIYDLNGRQSATIDALGRTTGYTYDGQGRLTQTTYPDQTTATSGYDANGNRTSSTDALNRTTTYVYDALNRLVQTIYPDNTTNTTVYDPVGRVAQSRDARGAITAYAYDAAGRRLAVTNAFGTTVAVTNAYAYDANGNQIIFTDGANHSTTNVFDALNRQVQVLYPDGTKTITAYDGDGRQVATTNQDNIGTQFGYDGAGRLTSVTNWGGGPTQVARYQYDEAGNEVVQLDALKRTNTFVYDGLGRRIVHAMPGLQSEGFSYDLAGNLIYHTNFSGSVVTNQYDVMNRLTNAVSANGYQVAYGYTPTGQRQLMVDGSGISSYQYDQRDRLTYKQLNWSQGPAIALYYQYDANGSVTNLSSSTANGVTNVYSYDILGRLTNVLAGSMLAASYGYDAVGNLQTMRYANGVTNLYQYDSLNRLTSVTWKTNATVVANFSYLLGPTGTRTNLTETLLSSVTNRIYNWTYDSLYRMTNEAISVLGSVGYKYDVVGNRTNRINGTTALPGLTNQNFTFNANDWLATDTYDSNGNTTAASGKSYYYDAMNRLTNVNNSIYIAYDGDGNRVSKTVGSTATFYLLDDRNPSGYVQVLEEWTVTASATNLAKVYNYGSDLISQRVPNSSTNYFIYDGHGSTRVLTDNAGSVANVFAYDAYGTLIVSNTTAQTFYLYSGQQFDPDLVQYYLRARTYNQGTGRFWTMDTSEGDQEDPLSLHKYLYCQGNPVNRFDPSGHDDLVDLLTTMTIQSGMSSMIMPVVSSALSSVGGQAVAAFIPQQVTQEISSSPEPDAVLFSASVSGSLPVGRYPVGVQVGGGIECLVSPKTHNAALYGYAGGGLTFGPNSKSTSGQAGFGFVFNTKASSNYRKHFVTLSFPYSKAPASIRNNVSKFLARGFGAQFTGASSEVIDAAKSIGCDFATAVNLGTVNIFFDPTGGGSAGISFSTQRVGDSAPSNIGATYSYYWQILPGNNKDVPFR